MAEELTQAGRDRTPVSERQLLLHCARAGPDPARFRSLVEEGVRKGLDWDALASAADYHGLSPLLYSALRSCGLLPESDATLSNYEQSAGREIVPEKVASLLREGYRESAQRNLVLTGHLLALLEAFETAGIAVVSLKGPVLAESLYSDPVLRPFSDLDLLVRRQDIPAALRLLEREGYALGPHLARLPLATLLGLHCELLLRGEHRAQVDLQWEIAPADYPFRFDAEILWRSLGRTRIAGREIACLSPESLLLFLCVHGAKHMWSRLQWLGDIARLAGSQPDWTRAWELAVEAGCARPVLLGLLLAHELLEAPVPSALLERAGAAAVLGSLARQVVLRLNRIPPAEPESLEITAFNARMAERTWHKVRHCAALLKAPTEAELEWLALPANLFFLYYPLRVARLAIKYGARLFA